MRPPPLHYRYEAAIHEYKCIIHSEEKLKSEQTVLGGSDSLRTDSDKENVTDELKQAQTTSDQPESSLLSTFLDTQITGCYSKLSSWSDLLRWKESGTKHTGDLLHRQFSKNSNLDYIW